MKQSIKAKRNIGLIVLTVLVVVAIVLVIYFVQKADLDGRIKKGAIGQTLSAKSADVCVSHIYFAERGRRDCGRRQMFFCVDNQV